MTGLERVLVLSAVPATFGLVALGFALGSPVLLPLLEAVPAWYVMATLLRRRRRGMALAVMLLWAAALGVAITVLSYAYPERAERALWHGPAYAEEMLAWIRTGEGAESRPRQFIPQHALHFTAYAFLSLLSASLLGILMGALLMGYMSHYVATLARMSAAPVSTALLGWHFWSIVRVASFVAFGVLLAEPLLSRTCRYDPRYGRRRLILAVAAAGLVLDVILKSAVAEPLRMVLRRLTGIGD